MFTFNETDKAVQELLNKKGIKYSFNYLGAPHDDEWPHDLWNITFHNTSSIETFTYKTGLGHREDKGCKFHFNTNFMKEIKAHRDALNPDGKLHFNVKPSLYAVAPTAASVLYCLLLDASASEENFKSWCDNFGYDSDSLKALSIYNACIENAEKINKIFKPATIEQLNTLLEEY